MFAVGDEAEPCGADFGAAFRAKRSPRPQTSSASPVQHLERFLCRRLEFVFERNLLPRR